jgi:hypothetical protein|tara:strand:- start:239 stop:418 length:180 start_codon:yes stop_codon:yes gene_type:complete
MRMIPPESFRRWASIFREGGLYDDYADELADLLDFLADNAEFNLALEEARSKWTNERLH